jgi:hypothetical protein
MKGKQIMTRISRWLRAAARSCGAACPVCHTEYATSMEALVCAETHYDETY